MSPRSSQRVDRRRRVLADESRNDEPLTRPRIFRGDDEGPLSRYDEAALRAINAPIARYLPFRPFSLMVWFLVGLIPILGLMLLDQRRYHLAEWLGTDALRIFSLTEPGNLASWCASVAFAAAALVILAIYSVRRHRRDDYRARFAMWQWVMVVTLVACLDSAVGLHGLLQAVCDRMFGTVAWGQGSAWWVGAWAVLISAATIRLAVEMSGSRRSIAWMVGGVVCYLFCGLVELGTSGLHDAQWARASQAPLLLFGHHLILFALVTYARDVIREAMGIVDTPADTPASQAELANAASTDAKSSSGKANTSSTTAKSAAKAKGSATPQLRAVTGDDSPAADQQAKSTATSNPPVMKVVGEDDDESLDTRNLSRAERKRLKKEQRRRKAA